MPVGLKTLISDVPDAFGPSVAQRLTVRLLGGVDQDKTVRDGVESVEKKRRRETRGVGKGGGETGTGRLGEESTGLERGRERERAVLPSKGGWVGG